MAGLSHIGVVLVGPKSGRNVGAVCRAMKTMGITALAVAGAGDLDIVEAERVAVHASDILSRAVFSANLEEVVKDSSLVVGITRRRGKKRKYFSLLPEELAERIVLERDGTVSLVFGNEESGLSDEELGCCDLACRIPTSPLFPSLNLSHAVQIITYQIYRRAISENIHPFKSVSRTELDGMIAVILGSLTNIGFFKQVGPADMGIFLRDLFARAHLSPGEARRVEKIFRKISGLGAGKGVSPGKENS